ncbi:HAD-IB family hydrolase [Raineya orbicola]|jgi:HAD superfamily hydrolase (TIGR01490 family)|uniref:HAD-SF-IB-hyp1: HAD hydrolase, family IB n=1 Tax=Raineya orbicola TaxID=2016530 RepID=A0A2N3I7P5_9BACT|nr:HAD-IB family hydrolase [Raineya orbicola]PKQ66319.1 HAD-SF-IB-hyp1: HAD hydrolase, family IB [Raineya orbicola]
MKAIVFTDFDGTLSHKDSFFLFLKYYFGKRKLFIGILSNISVIILYKIKLLSNEKAKQKIFKYFFQGEKFEIFTQKADYFAEFLLPTILKPAAIQVMREHIRLGREVVVVTASFENYLQKWCKKEGFSLIATKIEVQNETLTGNFASANCYGIEKVRRIKEIFDLSSFSLIYAYGDTKGDKPMLSLAHYAYYKPF